MSNTFELRIASRARRARAALRGGLLALLAVAALAQAAPAPDVPVERFFRRADGSQISHQLLPVMREKRKRGAARRRSQESSISTPIWK